MKLNKHLPQLCLVAILTFAVSPALRAQQAAAETLQQRVTSTSQTSSLPAVPSGVSTEDLGQIAIVQEYPKPETLTVSVAQQFFYTDNVFFTSEKLGTASSLAYLGSYTGSYVPYSLRDWTPRVTVQYNMVRYKSVASGDFDNENAAFSSQYIFGDDRSWAWTAAVTLSNFTAPHVNDHQFYKEVIYDNQVSNVQQFIKNFPLYFISSYDLAYHQASPAIFDRLDNTLSASCMYYPIPQVSIGPFFRPGARVYVTNGTYANGVIQSGRADFNLAVGFDVTWTPCKYVAISADLSHVNDYSNNVSLGYGNTTPGLSIVGTVKFW